MVTSRRLPNVKQNHRLRLRPLISSLRHLMRHVQNEGESVLSLWLRYLGTCNQGYTLCVLAGVTDTRWSTTTLQGRNNWSYPVLVAWAANSWLHWLVIAEGEIHGAEVRNVSYTYAG